MESPRVPNKIPRSLAKEYATNWKDSHGSFPGKPEVSPKYWVFNWSDLKELIDDTVNACEDSDTTLLAAVRIYLGCKRQYVSSKDLEECTSVEDFVMLAVPVIVKTVKGEDRLEEQEVVNKQVVISEKVISFGQANPSLDVWNNINALIRPNGNIVSKRVQEYFDIYEKNNVSKDKPRRDRRIANDNDQQIFSWRVDIDDLFDIYDSQAENKDKQLVFRLGRKFSGGVTLISVAYFNGLARASAPVLFAQQRERPMVNRRSLEEEAPEVSAPASSADTMSRLALDMTEVFLNDYYPPDPPVSGDRSLHN